MLCTRLIPRTSDDRRSSAPLTTGHCPNRCALREVPGKPQIRRQGRDSLTS